MRFKTIYRVIILGVMVLAMGFLSWQYVNDPFVQKDFSSFADEVAKESIVMSPLNASFTYGDLEEEGLKNLLYELDLVSVEEIEKNKAMLDSWTETLETYDRSTLSGEDQMLYDMLEFQLDSGTLSYDYVYYDNNFNPTFGLQISMPLTLVQLELETKEEVEGLLSRLKQLPTFYDNAIELEYIKAEKELLLQPYLYELAVEQIDQLVTTPDTFLLYQGFCEQINQVDFLSEDQKISYKEQCYVLIETELFPAYERMKSALIDIGGMSHNTVGTSEFERSKKYYETLLFEKHRIPCP